MLARALGGVPIELLWRKKRRKPLRLVVLLDASGQGGGQQRHAALRSPAGLNIGVVTPEEIALSILAEIVELRRRAARTTPGDAVP